MRKFLLDCAAFSLVPVTMRGMVRKTAGGVLGLALALCIISLGTLPGAGSADAATILSFSDVSSDETSAGVLTANTTFTVSGNQLLIDIDNQSQYQIAQLYFNSHDGLTGLAFSSESTDFNADWSIVGTGSSQDFGADGFGGYNWLIDFGSGSNRLDFELTKLTLDMTGSNFQLLESTIGSKFSVIPPGDIQALAAMKFEAGPNGDSAFGAVVPLPSTVLLLGAGLLGLFGIRKKKLLTLKKVRR